MIPVEQGVENHAEADLAVGQGWTEALLENERRIGWRFARSEARQEGMSYLRGLLSPVGGKNSWQLAEAPGEATPYRIQHLLGRGLWEADSVRDDLRQYVIDHLANGETILVVDEMGFLKKGRHSEWGVKGDG